jgi:hypothetical protein
MSEQFFFQTKRVETSDIGVDHERKALTGVIVAEVGEAKGHGIDLDETTLDQIVQFGNASRKGPKVRFTHPNFCRDGLSDYLGRTKNFRRDGNKVRADVFLGPPAFKTPNSNVSNGDFILSLAEHDPEAFGASMACYAIHEERKDDDGKPIAGAKPLLRLTGLPAVDMVGDPAATSALFSSSNWAVHATAMLQQFATENGFPPAEVARRVTDELIPRYLQMEGVAMSDAMKTEPSAPAAPTADPPKVDLDAVKREAMELERKRVSTLQSLAANHKCEHLLASWIEKGTLPTDAKDEVLSVIQKRDVPLGNGGTTETEKPKPPAEPGQKYRDEFRANEAYLSDQMGLDEDGYVETCLAAEKNGGWVKASSVARKAG